MSKNASPLHFGIVTEVSLDGTVRVRFPDHQNVQSWWLKIVVPKTQDDKEWYAPDIGEMGACLMDAHLEDGVYLGAIYSTVDTPPAGATANQWIKQFSDGTKIQYDRSTHSLTAVLAEGGTATLTAPGGINLNGVTIDSSGNLHSPATITGAVDVIADGISGKNHVHPGVASGGSDTDPPTG